MPLTAEAQGDTVDTVGVVVLVVVLAAGTAVDHEVLVVREMKVVHKEF